MVGYCRNSFDKWGVWYATTGSVLNSNKTGRPQRLNKKDEGMCKNNGK